MQKIWSNHNANILLSMLTSNCHIHCYQDFQLLRLASGGLFQRGRWSRTAMVFSGLPVNAMWLGIDSWVPWCNLCLGGGGGEESTNRQCPCPRLLRASVGGWVKRIAQCLLLAVSSGSVLPSAWLQHIMLANFVEFGGLFIWLFAYLIGALGRVGGLGLISSGGGALLLNPWVGVPVYLLGFGDCFFPTLWLDYMKAASCCIDFQLVKPVI